MKYGMVGIGLAALLGIGLAGHSVANDARPIMVDTRADLIRSQQDTIRTEALARKGRYRDMDQATLDRLLRVQDQVLASLDGKSSSMDLSPPDQLTLFNQLEEISAIVNKAEDDRMVCERVRRTGSHRTENVCKTVAQRRHDQEAARNALGNRDSRCLTPQCGGASTMPEGW